MFVEGNDNKIQTVSGGSEKVSNAFPTNTKSRPQKSLRFPILHKMAQYFLMVRPLQKANPSRYQMTVMVTKCMLEWNEPHGSTFSRKFNLSGGSDELFWFKASWYQMRLEQPTVAWWEKDLPSPNCFLILYRSGADFGRNPSNSQLRLKGINELLLRHPNSNCTLTLVCCEGF
jgi:hypothetical protein